ncbi:hypothetical protein VB713_26960 [Anabaena cylindrica UHCC 0172]|uniref:hypothetical protein n=1 Tax=Anabaena cylindrica TaxID=1165 RepID=UPI002B2008E3|nr:hypothetical protein [Anabaena cylindrica]MEA5554573.1 hypothetical protein [Anabaena cylindrica UHCC 0172]
MLNPIFERFAEASPITVMLRATLEKIFSAELLDEIFEATRKKQYTQELLFSTVVGIMSLVVCNIRPSISAAYKAFEKEIGVSRVALYSKINGIEPQVSQALVRYSSHQLAPIVEELGGKQPEILPGYRIKIIDGNNLATTEHRLSVLRNGVHGQGKVDAGISNYYLVEEIQSTYTGMMIAIPEPEWKFVSTLNLSTFVELLKQLAAQVDLKRFTSSPRGPKKPQPQRPREPHRPHVSTARLLALKQPSHQASIQPEPQSNVVEIPATQKVQS